MSDARLLNVFPGFAPTNFANHFLSNVELRGNEGNTNTVSQELSNLMNLFARQSYVFTDLATRMALRMQFEWMKVPSQNTFRTHTRPVVITCRQQPFLRSIPRIFGRGTGEHMRRVTAQLYVTRMTRIHFRGHCSVRQFPRNAMRWTGAKLSITRGSDSPRPKPAFFSQALCNAVPDSLHGKPSSPAATAVRAKAVSIFPRSIPTGKWCSALFTDMLVGHRNSSFRCRAPGGLIHRAGALLSQYSTRIPHLRGG